MNGNSYDFSELFNDKFFKSINFIDETKIFNELQNNKKILIFDFRPKSLFKQNHLENSINLPIDEIEVESLNEFDDQSLTKYTEDNVCKSLIYKYKRLFIVIICSQEKINRNSFLLPNKNSINEELNIGKILSLFRTLKNNKVRELGIFNKGFNKILTSYNLMTIHHTCSSYKMPHFPNDLFNNKIFLGNQRDALNNDIVTSLKITHIINATNHIPNIHEKNGVKYLTIPVEDNETNKISPYFREAYYFIESALGQGMLENGDLMEKDNSSESICVTLNKASNQFMKAEILHKAFKKYYFHTNNNNKILIHCSLGVSRSSTIAIMYIMKKFSITFEEACNFVKFQKEESCPINAFLNELQELEKNNWVFI